VICLRRLFEPFYYMFVIGEIIICCLILLIGRVIAVQKSLGTASLVLLG
jgi:hypothetical protein